MASRGFRQRIAPQSSLPWANLKAMVNLLTSGRRWRKAETYSLARRLHKRIILLLTDGVLEPNLEDSIYAPYNTEYKFERLRSGSAERKRIEEKYRKMVSPVASRMLSESVLPQLRSERIEIFAIGLSSEVDRDFLDALTRSTSLDATEQHSFVAKSPTDLVDVFAGMLRYWSDDQVFQRISGSMGDGSTHPVYLDQYAPEARLLVLMSSDKGVPQVSTTSSTAPSQDQNLHPQLRSYLIRSGPDGWDGTLRVDGGPGLYNAVLIGSGGFQFELKGLNSRYEFGVPVEFDAVLHSTLNRSLPMGTHVLAKVLPRDRGEGARVDQDRSITNGVAHFRIEPRVPAHYLLHLTAEMNSSSAHRMLPRECVDHEFEVMPRFFALPDRLSFGTLERGASAGREIEIHYGLPLAAEVTISSAITAYSRSPYTKSSPKWPQLAPIRFQVAPGAVILKRVSIQIPRGGDWGDFQGVTSVEAAGAPPIRIRFTVHVPSVWEKTGPWILLVFCLLLAALAYLVWVLGFLSAPSGTLVPIGDSPGVVRRKVPLSSVRRSWISRWLNWRRNRIRFSELPFSDRLPKAFNAELVFYSGGLTYIAHCGADKILEIRERNGRAKRLGPNSPSYSLKKNAELRVEQFQYRYE